MIDILEGVLSVDSSEAFTTACSSDAFVDDAGSSAIIRDEAVSAATFGLEGVVGWGEAFAVDDVVLSEACADDHDDDLSITFVKDGRGEGAVSLGMGNDGWLAAFVIDEGATSESMAGGGSWPIASVDCNATRQASTEFIRIPPYGHQRTSCPEHSSLSSAGIAGSSR